MEAPPETLLQSLRALPRAAWILCLGSLVNRFGSFLLPFLLLYMVGAGHSLAEAGMAISGFGLGALVASLAGGWLADRFGRTRTIALSMFSSAAVLLLLPNAEQVPLLVALTFLAGSTSELYRPASSALLADLVPESRRVTAFALYRLSVNLGMAAGPAVGALLAERSFTLLFVTDAVTSLVLGVVALVALPETQAAAAATAPEEPRRGALDILGDRAFVLFLLGMMVANVIGFQLGVVMPLHVTGAGHSVATYGMLVSLNCVLVVLLEVPLTRWTRRLRPERAIAAGHLLSGLGYALLVGVRPAWAMAIAVVVLTSGEMLAAPVSSAYVAALAPPHARGRYMGAFGLTFAAGLTLAPLAGTTAWQLSPVLFCAGCATLGAAAAGVTLLSARVRRGYRQATPAPPG